MESKNIVKESLNHRDSGKIPIDFGSTAVTGSSGACDSDPCLNSYSCVDLSSGYLCLCNAGFTGSYCEMEINECASIPCVNGGTCWDFVNHFVCHCAMDYTGAHCEMHLSGEHICRQRY